MTDYDDDYDYDETASQDWDLDALAQRVKEQSVLGAPDPQSSRRLALLQLVERSIAEVPAARQGASERAVQGALDAWQATSTPIRAHNRSRNRASWRALLMSGGTIAAIAIGVVGLISVFRQHESDRNIAFSSAASTTTRDASASKSVDNASTPNQASAGTSAAGETSAAASSPPAARDLESSLTGQNTVRDLGTVNNLQDALNRALSTQASTTLPATAEATTTARNSTPTTSAIADEQNTGCRGQLLGRAVLNGQAIEVRLRSGPVGSPEYAVVVTSTCETLATK